MQFALTKKFGLALVALALAPCGGSSIRADIVLLQDGFNSENGSNGVFNYSAFANWNVIGGTVDLVGNGFSDIYPGNGLYVDLDGSTNDAARLESKALFALDPGDYELRFDIGNNNVTSSSPNTATVSLGGVFSEGFTRQGRPALETIVRLFRVSSVTDGRLAFDHAGGDNGGIVIDDVRLTRLQTVPEPASFVLCGLGMVGVVGYARRQKPRLRGLTDPGGILA